ncbi:efflux RND transporter periplasmic adaptor subunit [Campylobacter ureolyticus]|uniref:efflux RND transporter periplasmic adaptor subunit n=1 Tax=Campylobacter ureolyticus TaxID=827 RepID=UPI0022B451E0|nr:efflux RND transporter periplasmic adaptor subunit [Campylobacter ureolyticus]MCZ6111945.1 efflux RND transporter periplasmic adaptor subunit [Campylobacter ureolyticus]
MKKKWIFFIVILLIVIACFKFFNKKEEVDYFTIKPTKGDFANVVVATGEVSAQNLIDVGAQVSGQIQKLFVKTGDMVKKGEIIAKIDSVKQSNEVGKLKAENEILLADLNASEISLKILNSKFQRQKTLFSKNATSKEALDDAYDLVSLKASQISQTKAKILQNQIDLDTAMTNLGYTEILSPLDGIVISTIVKEGQTVNANQTTPLIVQIADLSKLEINMQIAEGDLPKVKTGMKVRFSILADPNKKFEGVISSIDPAMTTLSDGVKNTQTSQKNEAVYYYAKMLVDNSDNFLKIGMTTENEIIIDEVKDAIYIPKNAVFKENDKFFVSILKDNEAVKKQVTLGIEDGFYTQIKSGINENYDVILNNEVTSKKSKMSHPGGRNTRM